MISLLASKNNFPLKTGQCPIRGWVHDFSPLISAELRKRRSGGNSKKWHVDETYLKINGEKRYLWRAIDGDGNLVDVHLSEERSREASDAFLERSKLVAGSLPERVVSDGWQGYPNAITEVLGSGSKHECTKGGATWQYANNRLERFCQFSLLEVRTTPPPVRG